MKWPDIATFLIAHAVAAATYFALFLAVPAVLGGIAVILSLIGGLITGDMGGPLFLPAVFVMGLLYALCVAALGFILFLVVCGIQILRRYIRIPTWIPIALQAPIIFTVVVLSRPGGVIVSLAVSAAFLTYWLAFAGADAILKGIRKKWKRNRTQNSTTRA